MVQKNQTQYTFSAPAKVSIASTLPRSNAKIEFVDGMKHRIKMSPKRFSTPSSFGAGSMVDPEVLNDVQLLLDDLEDFCV